MTALIKTSQYTKGVQFNSNAEQKAQLNKRPHEFTRKYTAIAISVGAYP